MDHAATIRRLYEALGVLDGEAMAACYHPDARFEDPVFGRLDGPQVGAMWRMLTSRSRGIESTVSDIAVSNDHGTARWEARYDFGNPPRPVVNRATAEFRFADGLISHHVDRFSFHRWARQALGPTGLVLGWAPPFQGRVRMRARAGLRHFER